MHCTCTHLRASGVHILDRLIIRWVVDSDPSSVSVIVIARYSSYNIYMYKNKNTHVHFMYMHRIRKYMYRPVHNMMQGLALRYIASPSR